MACCAASLLSFGQIGSGIPPLPPPQPGPLSDAVFGAVAAGEFTGDLGLDAVVLDEGVPTLCMSPEVFLTSARWDGGVATDLLLLDWDGDGADEVALLTVVGMELHAAGGSLITYLPWSASPCCRTPARAAPNTCWSRTRWAWKPSPPWARWGWSA